MATKRSLMRGIFFAVTLLGLAGGVAASPLENIRTVFIILMENHNWSSIEGSANAPYINNTLLPMSSYCKRYYNPPGLHPSEPNYIWLEAGTNFGIFNNNLPAVNSQSTTNHLVTQLKNAGISWRSYQENITGTDCPVYDAYPYAPKHNPVMFFDDVIDNTAYCISNNRPYTELAGHLLTNNVARYNFITPNLTNDMHDAGCSGCSGVRNGDNWLSREIPRIMASQAFADNGAIFITWDEGGGGSDGPIGMMVISGLAKGGGYFNTNYYNHSSTLRTMQTIFGVRPFLRGAQTANDLSDLFVGLTLTATRLAGNRVVTTVGGIAPGQTIVLEHSSDLDNWTGLSTNVINTTTRSYTNSASGTVARFYRARLGP